MSARVFACVLALLAGFWFGAPAQAAVPVQVVTSPGGIKAWLVSDSTIPMIVLRAHWEGGVASEPPRLQGVTALMADMLTEGAGSLDANAFKERLDTLNMSLGFSAGWDGVDMGLTTLSKNRDAAFEMARLALTAPRFDAAPLDRIKRQSLVGLRQRETNPSFIANRALDEALIPGHPYSRRTSKESIEAITRADLPPLKEKLLTRARLSITVAGDISAPDLARLLDATFGALPAQGAFAPPPDVTPKAQSVVVVKPLPQPQSLVLFAAPGIQDEDPDWIPLTVANYILGGGGFSSRLMAEVREKRGLVYGVGSGPSVYDHAALIRGSAQTENEDVAAAIEVIRAEIGRLYREGASAGEIEDAKRYLTGSFALDLYSNVAIADVLHRYHVAGREADYVNRRNALIEAVTKADVDRLIKRLFNPEAFTFIVVGQPAGLAAPRPGAS